MIYIDKLSYPVEQGGDGGDSSMRLGMLLLCKYPVMCNVNNYEIEPGYLRRYPYAGQACELPGLGKVQVTDQDRWNNKWNFSRDQLIALIAGLNSIGRHDIIRRVFYKHMFRLFLCQNFQHARVGTWKYPWPHKTGWLHKDPMTGEAKEEIVAFSMADILLPQQIWCLIKGAKFYPLYPFYFIALPFYVLDLLIHTYVTKHYEENQFIAQSSFYGKWALRLYRKLKKNWHIVNRQYWFSRNEVEYADMLEKYVREA